MGLKTCRNLIVVTMIYGFSAVAQQSPRISILQIDTMNGVSLNSSSLLTSELAKATERIVQSAVILKSRDDLTKIFYDHGVALPTTFDANTIAKIGRWLNVRYIIHGTLGGDQNQRYTIHLQMTDVDRDSIVSALDLNVLDYKHKLFLNRLAQLLVWGRLTINPNISPSGVMLDGRELRDESMDPDYHVWLIEPETTHTLEVKPSSPKYSIYKDTIFFGIAESKNVVAKMKYRLGVLDLTADPEAEVYLNNEMIGTTTLQKELQAAQYTLTLKASRHDDVERKITIAAEETTSIREFLPVNRSSYRRNGIISAAAAALFIGGGLYSTSEANKAYERYLETMDTRQMSEQRDKAKILDYVSYACYVAAGGFAVWSTLEWIGLLRAHDPSAIDLPTLSDHVMNLSLSSRGITFRLQL
jgi:hypothetical protein